MRPKALTAASRISTTSQRKSGTISLYMADDNPFVFLSLRSVFIESGEELNIENKSTKDIKIKATPDIFFRQFCIDNIKTLLSKFLAYLRVEIKRLIQDKSIES